MPSGLNSLGSPVCLGVLGLGVSGLGFRVVGLWFWVYGFGFLPFFVWESPY